MTFARIQSNEARTKHHGKPTSWIVVKALHEPIELPDGQTVQPGEIVKTFEGYRDTDTKTLMRTIMDVWGSDQVAVEVYGNDHALPTDDGVAEFLVRVPVDHDGGVAIRQVIIEPNCHDALWSFFPKPGVANRLGWRLTLEHDGSGIWATLQEWNATKNASRNVRHSQTYCPLANLQAGPNGRPAWRRVLYGEEKYEFHLLATNHLGMIPPLRKPETGIPGHERWRSTYSGEPCALSARTARQKARRHIAAERQAWRLIYEQNAMHAMGVHLRDWMAQMPPIKPSSDEITSVDSPSLPKSTGGDWLCDDRAPRDYVPRSHHVITDLASAWKHAEMLREIRHPSLRRPGAAKTRRQKLAASRAYETNRLKNAFVGLDVQGL